jgi:hypothetical protein
MSFGLTPKEYLAMVVEAYEDFKANPLSIRHLLSVCTLANHLPEIVASKYATSDPAKINNCIDGSAYRDQAANLCPDVGIVHVTFAIMESTGLYCAAIRCRCKIQAPKR